MVKVATNDVAPRFVTDKSTLSKAEVTTMTLDCRDSICQVTPVGRSRVVDLHIFRKARVVGEVTWADDHTFETAAASDDDDDESAGNEKTLDRAICR